MGLFMDLLIMLGGVAVFMFGMKQMSQGMDQGAGVGIRNLFKKIDKNRMIDYGIGIGATVVVQSSSATSIMTVGLANADIITVKQGAGIILGAKVGTTLTAFVFAIGLVSKGSFKVTSLFAAAAFVGVLIMYITNKESLKKVAIFLAGFGMLFVGLEVMEFAIGGQDSALSTGLTKLFQYEVMKNPVLLIVLGILFTCIIQSSTAATGIFLAFLATGVIGSVDQSFFLIMGANIGTCSDGLMAAIGSNANGKRIAIFHVMTSVIGALIFSIILICARKPITSMFESTFSPQWSLAIFNLSYNILYTLMLLPFRDLLVKFVSKIVKDRKSKEKLEYSFDERLLTTPIIAIEQALKEVSNMAEMSRENLDTAFNGLINGDTSQSKKIADKEYRIDDLTRALASFFIKISATSISSKNEKLIAGLHHVINDIERIGDYAVLFAKETNYMEQQNTRLLDETKTELNEIYSKIKEMMEISFITFKTRKTDRLKDLSLFQKEISELISDARETHIKRLSASKYSVEVSKSLYAVLLSMQRVTDHTVNIAFSIRSETGSKTEAFKNIEKEQKKIAPPKA